MACQYKKVLDELAPCECENKYCFFKIFFELSKFDQRSLCQIKCLEKYKWEKNKSIAEDIGWERATEMWILDGSAQLFADLYSDELTAKEIYAKMFSKGE